MGIALVEHTHGGTLRDHHRMFGVKLGDGHHGGLKLHQLVLGNVAQRGIRAHPGGTAGGVDGKNALTGIEEVCRVAGDLKGGERAGGGVLRDGLQRLPGGVVEEQNVAFGSGIIRSLLAQKLDHHVVGGFVDEGDHDLLPVHHKISLGILRHGGLGNLPHKVPGELFGKGKAQLFHEGLVHIAGLGGAHIGDGVVIAVKGTFLQELGNDLGTGGGIKPDGIAAQTVFRVVKQPVQRNNRVHAGEVGGDMVGIGDAHIGGGVGGNVGDHVVVNAAVIGIKPQIDLDIGVKCLKIGDGLLINGHLGQVGVVFCPEGDLVLPGFVKVLGHGKGLHAPGAVTGTQRQQTAQGQQQCKEFSHPLVPPLETPSMILLRKSKNSTISGREMTTTAAIMAGIFSRPKPPSRMA